MHRTDYILFDHAVYNISRFVRAGSQYFMLLLEVAPSLSVDAYHAYFVTHDNDTHDGAGAMRFVHLCNACAVTCFWSIPAPSEGRVYLVPKY